MPGELQGRVGVAEAKDRVTEAIASYHRVLNGDTELGRATAEALRVAHEQRGLMIHNRLLCNVMRPRFMDDGESQALARVAEAISAVLERAGEHFLSSDRLLDRAGASEAEKEIWAVDPGYPGLTLTSRLDSFIGSAGPRFIEYNAESPAGIGFCDVLTEVFADLPAMRA